MKYRFILILLPALLLCQMASAQSRTIFLVRHGEATSTAPDATLSPAGQKRAECLAKMLKDAGIRQIYVTDLNRTQQTAAPLATTLKLKPTVIPAKDPNTLIRDLAYAGGPGNILVVGHSNTLPFVLARLKAGSVPGIGDNEYDRMFVVTVTEGSALPVSTLRYCDCGSLPVPPTEPRKSPNPATKGATKKNP